MYVADDFEPTMCVLSVIVLCEKAKHDESGVNVNVYTWYRLRFEVKVILLLSAKIRKDELCEKYMLTLSCLFILDSPENSS